MESACILLLFFISAANCILVQVPNLGSIHGFTTSSTWTNRTIYQFLSVKYAMAPSGERRFAPPEPVEPWMDEIYNATVQGRMCPQISQIKYLNGYTADEDLEDCLMLNIFSPMIPDNNTSYDKLLPVMFYIHGGGYYEGSNRMFAPNYLLENDVVLVVPQYRLGPFGFLSLHTDEVPGNVGLMDQVQALKWVNKHIASFGGDNSRVTIFGQSAGAASVSFHLLSSTVDSYLFQKAILQSGSAFADWPINNNPIESAKRIYQTLTNDTEECDVEIMQETFKNASVVDLLNAVYKVLTKNPKHLQDLGFPVIQKAGTWKYLTEYPDEIMKSGKYRTVPMIAGVTKNDGSFITTFIYDILEKYHLQDDDNFLRHNLTQFMLNAALIKVNDPSDAIVDYINYMYFKKTYEQSKNLTFVDVQPGITDVLSTFVLKAPTLKHAKINAQHMNETYLYTFDYKGEYSLFGYGSDTSKYPFDGGVHHSDDLIYLFFFGKSYTLNEEDTKIAKLMTSLWSKFATSGVPESSSLQVKWPTFTKETDAPYLHIQQTSFKGSNFVENEYFATTKAAEMQNKTAKE